MNIRFYYNEDFEIYQTGDKSFSLAYHEAGVAAIFESYGAAKLATKKDLNAVEELWAKRKAAGNVEPLTTEELKNLENSDNRSGNGGDNSSD
jgi:hypothetical protein